MAITSVTTTYILDGTVYKTKRKSISKSFSKFHSLNYYFETLLHKDLSLYVSIFQQFFYIFSTL